jgi:hypothetical protein
MPDSAWTQSNLNDLIDNIEPVDFPWQKVSSHYVETAKPKSLACNICAAK